MSRARLALVATSVLAAGLAGWLVYQVVQPDVQVLPLRLCLERLERVAASPELNLCTHGQDPEGVRGPGGLCLGGICAPVFTRPPAGYACTGDGVSGDRIQMFYAYVRGITPPSDWLARSRAGAAGADAYLSERTGRHYRFVCSGSAISVRLIEISERTLTAFVQAVPESRSDRFYAAFVAGQTGGIATGSAQFESTDPARHRGPQYSLNGAYQEGTLVHELAHNMGAVALSAPHSTGFWHCWDAQDVMCYDDGGDRVPPGGVVQVCPTPDRYDCRNDDYYSQGVLPRWNLALSTFIE